MQVDDGVHGRSEVVSCRCTPLQAQLIRTLAAKDEQTVSDYLRAAALAGVAELARELGRATEDEAPGQKPGPAETQGGLL